MQAIQQFSSFFLSWRTPLEEDEEPRTKRAQGLATSVLVPFLLAEMLKCWPAELLLSRKGFTLSEKGPRLEGPLFEILRGDAVHPILELVHDLFFGGFFHRLFEHDTGLLDDFVGGEDLCSRADGEGYGVRWP